MWKYLTLLIQSDNERVLCPLGEEKEKFWQTKGMFFSDAFDYLGYSGWRLVNVVKVDAKLYAFFEKFDTKIH